MVVALTMKRRVSTSMPTTNPRMPPAAFCNKDTKTVHYGQVGHMVQSGEAKVYLNLPAG